MLAVPDSRKMVMARLRRLAMTRGPAAVRIWERSSSKSRSRTQCSRSSNNFGSTAFATWILVPRAGRSPAECLAGPPGTRLPSGGGRGVLAARRIRGRRAARTDGGERADRADLLAARRPAGSRDVVEGWTLVDDLIRFDTEDNAEYLGRTDYIISTAGYKIAPAEVENVLRRHPAVREVAVLGAPDPIRQVVSAFVVLKPGVAASDDLRRELQVLVRQRLSPYKYPRRLESINALPRDAVGKGSDERAAGPTWRAVTDEGISQQGARADYHRLLGRDGSRPAEAQALTP
jgi:acyl-CoA synthetase (AMP-forming)/AMP-acid ligase II